MPGESVRTLELVDPTTQAALAAGIGAIVAGGGVLAWAVSDRQQTTLPAQEEPLLPPGVATVLSVLRSSALVVDDADDVVQASAPAYALGLVRGSSLLSVELADLVRQVRRDGQIRETELLMTRPGLPARHVTARVAPLGSRLVLALVEGNSWGWGSTEIIGLLVAAAVALPAFVFVENRAKAPMVRFDLLRDRNFLGAVVVAMIISFAMLGVFFFLALYMQDILGYTPLEAGVRFLPSTLMIVGVAPVAGRLADRFGPRWLIAGGLTLVAASLFTFSGIAVDSGYLDLLPGFMLLGIGIAMTMSPMTSAAMNAVPVDKAGLASGVLSMFRMVGGSLGIAVTGAIFQGLVTSRLGTLLAGSGVSAAQRDAVSEQLGGGSVGHVPGLSAAQAKEVTSAGSEAFVYALGHAMTVSALVALLGAAIGATAIRAKKRALPTSVEAAEANVNPGGSALAAEEAEAEEVVV